MSFAEGTPTVQVQLGGKSYTLGWTWGAKRRLQEILATHGKDLSDSNAVSENLPAIVWASMDKETRASISVEEVEELIHPRNQVQIVEKIGSLFELSEPEVKTEPGAVKAPTPGEPSSSESGRLAATT